MKQLKKEIGHLKVNKLTIAEVDLVTALLLASGQVVDLNGEADALVLDADADTSISAPTDDQIDIEIAGADDFRFVANIFRALADSVIETDTINETTDDTGVTVDGVLLKDGGAVFADAATIEIDTIGEATAAAGVTVDGVLIKDGGVILADAAVLEVDTIGEATAAAGVTADGVLLKDGTSNGRRQAQNLTATGAITVGRFGMCTLAHATVVIAATLAAPTQGDDLIIMNTSASGTVAHTVTAAAGVTFDGTNNTLTLDAAEEAVHLVAVSATRWKVMENIGSVALSNV
jgi:hypothetical protein